MFYRSTKILTGPWQILGNYDLLIIHTRKFLQKSSKLFSNFSLTQNESLEVTTLIYVNIIPKGKWVEQSCIISRVRMKFFWLNVLSIRQEYFIDVT